MSRRDSDPKRQRSRIDREPSPKRSRREGKPDAERILCKKDLDVRDGTDTDKKPRQSLRDAAPLESDAHGVTKDSEKKHSAHHLSQVPRSRPYYQMFRHGRFWSDGFFFQSRIAHEKHDDLRRDGKGDRRATSERGSWRSSRDQGNRSAGDDEKYWRHDRFHESDDTQGALSRKRPAFREKKIPEESGNNTDRTRTEEAKDTNLNSRLQNERNWRSNMHSERHERPAMGRDRVWNRDDERGAGSRQSYRADRDGFSRNGRSGFHGSGTRDEKKWDHDLFEEANKSPARANEEEQIAKVEALLAS